ncbi:MAG: hypothetical protein RMI39_09945, partial [Thermoanaerobaculum sp.]|nr:hypothetical protein [Thermoanaerobaculum sp.]
MDLLPVVEKSALGLLPLLILAAIGALWIRALASKAWWPVVFMSIGSLVLGVLLFWPAKGLVTLFLRTLWDLPVFLKWWCLFLASSLYGFLCGTSVFGKRRVASFLTWMPFLLAIALIVLSMNLGLAVAGMAWVCWVATTLGKRLLAQQKVVSLLPLGFAVGLGSLLLLAWVLGTLGWLVTPSVTLFLTVFSVVFWRDAAFTLQKLWRWFRRPLPYQGTVRAFQGL